MSRASVSTKSTTASCSPYRENWPISSNAMMRSCSTGSDGSSDTAKSPSSWRLGMIPSGTSRTNMERVAAWRGSCPSRLGSTRARCGRRRVPLGSRSLLSLELPQVLSDAPEVEVLRALKSPHIPRDEHIRRVHGHTEATEGRRQAPDQGARVLDRPFAEARRRRRAAARRVTG